MIRVRFAPAPTNYMSVSAARVALVNCLHASRHGGRMLLRFDDLDQDRSRPAYAEAITRDLRWIGVEWNETLRQSERLDLYTAAIERLKQAGRLYPCFESEEELRAKRDLRQRRGQATVYDRAMLKLQPEQIAAIQARGKRPHWRFRLSDRTVSWDDLVLGPRQAKLPSVSDPILVTADGRPAPVLASVVDDIDTGITHIIRAEDNAGNTGIQIELLEALGSGNARVRFGHLPPLGDGGRARMGRRVAGMTLRGLRADGIEAAAIAASLARTISVDGIAPAPMENMARAFELSRLPGLGARFDAALLLSLNRQLLGTLDYAAVADRLPNGATEAFWLAVRGRIDLLNEARGWWDVVAGTIVPPVIDGAKAFLTAAEDMLPAEPWDEAVWADWTAALGRATGRAGDALAEPLRLALTGEDHGPDLADLLPLMGRARAAGRLRIAAA